MKDRVTFETAVRLKAAGFPQPQPEAGQYWYAPDGVLYWTQAGDGTYYTVRQVGAPNAQGWKTRFDGWVFAPSDADIFRSIGVTPFLYSANGDEMMFSILTNPERAASFWIGFNKRKHGTRMVRGSQ